MVIEVGELNLQLSGEFSRESSQAICDLTREALEHAICECAGDLSATPAGYKVSAISLPCLHVQAGASDEEIARTVASTIVRSILGELRVEK